MDTARPYLRNEENDRKEMEILNGIPAFYDYVNTYNSSFQPSTSHATESELTPSDVFNWKIFGFSILTTLGLQVLSNFANDYGDGMKGTDNEDRVGPKRAIQSGVISPQAMKRAIVITSVLTLISAMLLIYYAFADTNLWYSLFYLVLGILSIISAIRYTIGNKAYGYRGYGDLFVFVFFA